jgi:replicative DNA helicase
VAQEALASAQTVHSTAAHHSGEASRSGRMSDDWTRLARRLSEISEPPLYIDDSPNLTMMEIRAERLRRGGCRPA